jgi:hypothetical protein
MSDLKTFLKVLGKFGYPNTNPDFPTIAKMVDYPPSYFVKDLIANLGVEKTEEFINKTFSTLGLTYSPGMKIDLSDSAGEEGSYIYLIIHGFDILSEDSPDDPVWINYSLVDSHLIHDGEIKTLDDIYDEVDLGTMGEYEEFIDEIQYECQKDIFNKTGLTIHFDSQI